MIVRAFLLLDRGARALSDTAIRAAELAYKVHEGFWLGLLDREALVQATDAGYASAGRYLGDEHNESGLFAWERNVIEREFSNCRRILVASAGGGREVLALARNGFAADGFDPSPALVQSARARVSAGAPASTWIVSSPDHVPSELGVYDGGIVGWGGYSHIPDSAARIGLLRELAAHLVPGAPLLLSVWSRGEGERRLRVAAGIAGLMGRLGLAGKRVEIGDSCCMGFSHFFTKLELERELSEAGFRIGYYSELPCMHVVARVIGDAPSAR